jgi:hypothetical protein
MTLTFSGANQNIWYFDGGLTNISATTAFLSSASYRSYMTVSDYWATYGITRLFKPAGANLIDMTGPINQGAQTVVLNGTPGSLVMLGNPYPSGVRMSNPLTTATNIGDTVWVYNLSAGMFKTRASGTWTSLSLPMCGTLVLRLTSDHAVINFAESDKAGSPSAISFKPEGDDDNSTEENGNNNNLSGLGGSDGTLLMNVSPNPADDIITVTMNGKDAKGSIRIISLNGQVMMTSDIPTVQHGQITIPVNQLAKGMYTVELISGDVKVAQQFIKL